MGHHPTMCWALVLTAGFLSVGLAAPDGAVMPMPMEAGAVMPMEAGAAMPMDQMSGPEARMPMSVPAPAPGPAPEQSETYLLFIQQARTATLKLDPQAPLNGTLTLTGVAPQTVWFTDAPNRKAGQLDTGFFAGPRFRNPNDSSWLHTPNAALYGSGGQPGPMPVNDSVIIVTLFDPVYELANHTVTYKVTIIPANDDSLAQNPPTLKQAFVDTTKGLGPQVLTLPPTRDIQLNNVALFIDTWWLFWPWWGGGCWGPCCWGGCAGGWGGGWGGGCGWGCGK
eukprot:jgi/Botrbrau1/6438/Bobra.0034s0014.1